MIPQAELSLAVVQEKLTRYMKNRAELRTMGENARGAAILDASARIATTCVEVVND